MVARTMGKVEPPRPRIRGVLETVACEDYRAGCEIDGTNSTPYLHACNSFHMGRVSGHGETLSRPATQQASTPIRLADHFTRPHHDSRQDEAAEGRTPRTHLYPGPVRVRRTLQLCAPLTGTPDKQGRKAGIRADWKSPSPDSEEIR